jgi:Tol biopolymer transport system component
MMRTLAVIVTLLGLCGLAPTAQQIGAVSQLVWFDRTGTRVGSVGSFGDIGNIELSPDESRVAVAVIDPTVGTRDLWIYDVNDGTRTRLTSSPADENWLIWSPDGQRMAFNAFGRTLDLYQVGIDGRTDPDLLWRNTEAMWPVSWSPNGQQILVVTNSTETGNDIWVLPVTGDGQATPLLRTPAAENWASFSPDGRWIAYSSSDSGLAEVYVMPFPATGQRWQISSGGGSAARWRRDGAELYFVASDRSAWTARATDLPLGRRSHCSRRDTPIPRITPSPCRPTGLGSS